MDPVDNEQLSKSARKRRHHVIRDLGAALCDLTSAELSRIPLDDELMAIVRETARARKSARQRQLRYLAKRLAAIELAPVHAAYQTVKGVGERAAAKQHRLEHWRWRLIEEGGVAMEALLEAYPDAPRGEIYSLVRQARTEQARQRPSRSAKLLFRLLRKLDDEQDTGMEKCSDDRSDVSEVSQLP